MQILNLRSICAVFLLGFSPSIQAEENKLQNKIANILVISEAAYATSMQFYDKSNKKMVNYDWSATVEGAIWKLRVQGESPDTSARVLISGYEWNEVNGDLSVTYSGAGRFNSNPVTLHGRGNFDKSIAENGRPDFVSLRFSQVAKIGINSWWGWVKGSEIVLGGGLTAAGAVLAAPVTGGLSVLVGGVAAVQGALAGVSFSNLVRTSIESDVPVDPPNFPSAPSRPRSNQPLVPDDGQLWIAVSLEKNTIIGEADRKKVLISGKISNDGKVISGNVVIQNSN